MSDLIGICGQVCGLSSKLLQPDQIERMIESKDGGSAFQILVELQYAEYIDTQTQLSDFDSIIGQGLFETKEILTRGSSHVGLDFLWLNFDVNNIKRGLKQKLIEKKQEFEPDIHSVSPLGNLTSTEINMLVFEKKRVGALPYQILDIVSDAENLWEKHKDFYPIEMALDKALFDFLYSEISDDDFMVEFFSVLVNITQLRNVARSLLIRKEPLNTKGLLPYGNFGASRVEKWENFEAFEKAVLGTDFADILGGIEAQDNENKKMMTIENNLDKKYRNFLSQASQGAVDSPAILIDYFEKRMHNAQVLKMIMYGKLNDYSKTEIRDLLTSIQ